MRLRASPHLRKRLAALLAGLAMTTVLTVGVTPAPAQAAVCATRGHAYLTQPGRIYFSGYEGDTSVGVPRIVAFQGEFFSVGGNGINPKDNMDFEAFRAPQPFEETGTRINFLNNYSYYTTGMARDNCVVHEEGPYRVTAPPGTYRIFATYQSGNNPRRGDIFDVVADMVVFPGLPGISAQIATDSAAGTESLMSPAYSEPPPGGGGGGGGDPDPDPCESCPLPIAE